MPYNKMLIVSNMYPDKKYPSYGIFVKNFCDQLTELGIKHDIVALTKTQNKFFKVIKYGLFYTKVFLNCLLGGFDLVYIHYPSFSATPVLAARKLRKYDIITNVHGTDVIPLKPEHEIMVVNTRKAIALSKTVVAPSEYYKQLIINKYGKKESEIFVYPSAGVNEKIFYRYNKHKKDILKKEYGIDNDLFVIGFVSRINRAKGWDVFLDALEIVNSKRSKKIKVFMVGSGEDDEHLKKRMITLPQEIQESIIRYPLLEQRKLAEIYNMLDIFVFPSTSESLGLVAIEAMACGTPVIASDYAAPKYYIVDHQNGLKFTKGNSEELADKICYFMSLKDSEIKKLQMGALLTGESYCRKVIAPQLYDIFK